MSTELVIDAPEEVPTMCGFCYYEGGGKEGLIDTSDPDWEIGRGCTA